MLSLIYKSPTGEETGAQQILIPVPVGVGIKGSCQAVRDQGFEWARGLFLKSSQIKPRSLRGRSPPPIQPR